MSRQVGAAGGHPAGRTAVYGRHRPRAALREPLAGPARMVG